ncbi:MAG: hypothetical protein ACOYNB_10300 [Aquabacterium sp.]|uniref:hypothetical protein n=1 Tax=Aquabacterium sp. TaxID=1872578 RepID=UPI003BD286FC
MNRYTEQQLLNFCVAQHGRFDPAAWQHVEGVTPEQKACAMLLLSNARWYGRLQEMRDLVGQSIPNQTGRLTELASRVGFNTGLFVQRLQSQLWLSTEPKR